MPAYDHIYSPAMPPRLGPLFRAVRRGLLSVVRWNDARLARRIVGRLSLRQLADIGLSRENLEDRARR